MDKNKTTQCNIFQGISMFTKITIWLVILFVISPVVTAFIGTLRGIHTDPLTQAIYMSDGAVLYITYRAIFPKKCSKGGEHEKNYKK